LKHGNFAWLILALLVFLVGIPFAEVVDVIAPPLARALAFLA